MDTPKKQVSLVTLYLFPRIKYLYAYISYISGYLQFITNMMHVLLCALKTKLLKLFIYQKKKKWLLKK